MLMPATGRLIGTPASIRASVPPHTDAMLLDPFDSRISDTRRTVYGNLFTGGMTAFPFNAIWALGRIGTPKALAALERYQKGPHAHDAKLAIKAAKLRIQKHDKEVGVSSREDAQLFAAPNAKSKVLKVLVRGTPVKALSYRLASPSHEKAPGGGEAHYDQVKVLPNGPTGYLQRAGDDFATIY